MVFYEYEIDDQMENEDDLDGLDFGSAEDLVISNSDWTVDTVISQVKKGNIFLDPNFQRRDAWTNQRKSKFIESLFLGIPIPQLVLSELPSQKGRYIVLDGKQRLITLMQFASNEPDKYGSLRIGKLEIRKDLSGKTLSKMLDSGIDLDVFENQPIRTAVIKNCKNENFLYHIFLRLNTGSLPLSTQELRQALNAGTVTQYLDDKSAESDCMKQIFNTTKPDFRMRDAELLLRYFSFRFRIKKYKGNLKIFMDESLKEFDENWVFYKDKLDSAFVDLEKSHSLAVKVFGDDVYQKWNGNKYEGRFNRAIFDCIILSFSHSGVINNFDDINSKEIEPAFRRLSTDSPEFVTSTVQTTKSIGAVSERISAWNKEMNKIMGANILPELVVRNGSISIVGGNV